MNYPGCEIKSGLLLAPMAGVTDRAYRRIMKRYGAEYVFTEMVSAKGLIHGDASTLSLATLTRQELPASVQLFGHEPADFAAAVKIIASLPVRPTAIDINMGCPVKKVISNGEGSALMRDPLLAARICAAAAEASDLPVTVKLRTGWNESNKNAVEVARACVSAGAAAVTVHGRTREQLYRDPVDLITIAEVRQALTVPVVANGGLNTREDIERAAEITGCCLFMLARGTEGNPFIFSNPSKPGASESPTPDMLREAAFLHLNAFIEEHGSRIPVAEAARHISYYLKFFNGAAALRAAAFRSTSTDELFRIIESII